MSNFLRNCMDLLKMCNTQKNVVIECYIKCVQNVPKQGLFFERVHKNNIQWESGAS